MKPKYARQCRIISVIDLMYDSTINNDVLQTTDCLYHHAINFYRCEERRPETVHLQTTVTPTRAQTTDIIKFMQINLNRWINKNAYKSIHVILTDVRARRDAC